MSDGGVPDNLTIQVRNIVNRLVPVVNRHTGNISDLNQRIARLESTVAQQQALIDRAVQAATVAQALSMGTGRSEGGDDADHD